MEAPVSPASSIFDTLMDTDSDASSEFDDIYQDLDNNADGNSETEEVNDADIFQELGQIASEENQSSICKTSFEFQGNFLQDRQKLEYPNEQSLNESTVGRRTPVNDNDTLPHNLSQVKKEPAKKEEKTEGVVNNSAFVDEGGESERSQDSSVSTRSKTKRLSRKHTRDGTGKKSAEKHSKSRSKSCPVEHEERRKKENKTKHSHQSKLVALDSDAIKNKDLHFVLSRVMKKPSGPSETKENDSSTKKNCDIPSNQHPLPKDERSLCLNKPTNDISSVRSGPSQKNRREKMYTSKQKDKKHTSVNIKEEKEMASEVREGTTNDGGDARRLATRIKELAAAPTPEPKDKAPSSVIQNIMMMAGGYHRPAALDFMNVATNTSTTKKTKQHTIQKKSKQEDQDNQLDLFEDFLVGQDRDEVSYPSFFDIFDNLIGLIIFTDRLCSSTSHCLHLIVEG